MNVTLIGMGSGQPENLTLQGLAALRQADLILGARRLLAVLPAGCTETSSSGEDPVPAYTRRSTSATRTSSPSSCLSTQGSARDVRPRFSRTSSASSGGPAGASGAPKRVSGTVPSGRCSR